MKEKVQRIVTLLQTFANGLIAVSTVISTIYTIYVLLKNEEEDEA